MRYDPDYGLILRVCWPVYLLWCNLRGLPALLMLVMWLHTIYQALTRLL